MPLPENENTLTSTLGPPAGANYRMLALTILWHPDLQRIGEQFVAGPDMAELAVSRYAPGFCHSGGKTRSLDERCISREPLVLRDDGGSELSLRPPASRMTITVDGVQLTGMLKVDAARLDAGLVLELGGKVLVCAHWTDRLPVDERQGELIGVSAGMRKARAMIRQVAPTELPVLLLGETGTGKELAALAVHAASSRRDGPLVAVNMAALNDDLAGADLFGAARGAYTGADRPRSGFFAEAAGGTLFLDEIGDTPASVQPMLLRVLDSGEYRPLGAAGTERSRTRLIAATDRELGPARFNQPLLRRLESFVIRLPPLRERREDIGMLVVDAMRAWNTQAGTQCILPILFVRELCRHTWPGNVRQLRNVVRRAMFAVQSGTLPSTDLLEPVATVAPAVQAAAPSLGKPIARRRTDLACIDDDAVLAAMQHSGWEIRGAAHQLGISRPSLYKLLAAHPQIRTAAAIPLAELQAALSACEGDIQRCAMTLTTPYEALRRHVQGLGLGT